MPGKQGYAIGIHNHRAGSVGQNRLQNPEAAGIQSQAWANQQGIHPGKPLQDFRNGLRTELASAFRNIRRKSFSA